jgi:hypothetical protein
MADLDLRSLERNVRDAPDDTAGWVRYVRALDLAAAEAPADLASLVRRVRVCLAEVPGNATIAEGDEVWVEEQHRPWILGRWRGVVTEVSLEAITASRDKLQFRVRPIFDEMDLESVPWGTRVIPGQWIRGLQLEPWDRLELIARANRVDGPPPAK